MRIYTTNPSPSMIQTEEVAAWERKKSRLYSWNQCSSCGFQSVDTIFGEQYKPSVCPGCGKRIIDKEKDPDFDITKLPKIGKCRTNRRIIEECNKDKCAKCGFNDTEFQRRMHLPWKVKNGLLYKDISMKLEGQDDW